VVAIAIAAEPLPTGPAAAGGGLATEDQKVSYCIGLDIGRTMKKQGVPVDAQTLARGIADGTAVHVRNDRGSFTCTARVGDHTPQCVQRVRFRRDRRPLLQGAQRGGRATAGPGVSWPDELTSSDHRDPIAGTPYHKHVAVRLSLAPAQEAAACQMQSERIHARAAAG
jgi:hypothetical protein